MANSFEFFCMYDYFPKKIHVAWQGRHQNMNLALKVIIPKPLLM